MKHGYNSKAWNSYNSGYIVALTLHAEQGGFIHS